MPIARKHCIDYVILHFKRSHHEFEFEFEWKTEVICYGMKTICLCYYTVYKGIIIVKQPLLANTLHTESPNHVFENLLVLITLNKKKAIISEHDHRIVNCCIDMQSDRSKWQHHRLFNENEPSETAISRILNKRHDIKVKSNNLSSKSNKYTHHPLMEKALIN